MEAVAIKSNRGFTLIEIIAVLVILGVLSAVVVSKGFDSDLDLTAQAEAVRAHLRYARVRAMATDTAPGAAPTWGVRSVNGGTGYELYDDDGNAVALPGQDSPQVSLTAKGLSGITVFDISFDEWGEPYSSGSALSSDLSLTLSDGGDTATITIIEKTGFIP